MDSKVRRSGFVAVVGRPNVGKSTLVNALVGEKVAIVSKTPQTTRNRIAGIVNGPDYQVVLLDLPGFQKPLDLMTEKMQDSVNSTLREVDLVLVVLDGALPLGSGDRFVARSSYAAGTPVIIVINKTDIASQAVLLPLIQQAGELGPFEEVFPVSAREGTGLEGLKKAIIDRMPEGPAYFPTDTVTDQPERLLVAELIREQAIRLTREEVPHALAVNVLGMEERDESGVVDIEAVIIVEHESQKGIIIGRRGSMIREIGSRARREIEKFLGVRVYLDLKVRVRRKWRQDRRVLDELGI